MLKSLLFIGRLFPVLVYNTLDLFIIRNHLQRQLILNQQKDLYIELILLERIEI